jgi:opacity protein-like surface antigen
MALVALGAAGPASAEWFADLYSGGVVWVSPTIHVDVGGTSREKSKDSTVADFTIGGRLGYWLRPVPWLGFALDTSYYQFDVTPKNAKNVVLQDVELQVVPITPLVMARLPLLESPDFPTGRLQPYIGAGPGIFLHQRKIDFESDDRISDETVDVGADARAGVAWRFTPLFGIFAEYRFNYFSESADGDIAGGRFDAHSNVYINSGLAGIRFNWG